jgi:hypothetical protein
VNLNSNNKRVRTFRLPAGEYYFWSVTGDFFVQREFETSSYLPDKSLPIKTFTVEAGKGLSLGEILLEDFKYGEHITYDDDHINYTITNNFEEDLTAIKAAYPDFKGEIIDGTLQLME